MPNLTQIRTQNTQRCNSAGFYFAPSLPIREEADCTLRPTDEIRDRLAALAQLCLYVSAPPDKYPTEQIQTFIETHNLRRHLTEEEAPMLDMPRQEAEDTHGDSIGWKMENTWPLAWILGFEHEPAIDGQMISDLVPTLHTKFIPTDPDQYTLKLDEYKPRPLDEIVQLEDLFYCVHNAARCAMYNPPPPKWQFWNRQPQSVPPDFHPITSGGVIQERRHALTWALSPDVEWDDTDLST